MHVLLFAFDCLFLNGEVLVERPLSERRKALEAAIAPRQGVLQIATSKVRIPLIPLAGVPAAAVFSFEVKAIKINQFYVNVRLFPI